ncbi:hypothetical protein B5S33_g1942 [[Candida] boidinii]|nr:hypothetical protein B5S30_g2360 [[Candida] boidinii]OWB83313.1 hypothetical protein B5S33_g1942 [[Candida] boidinii]
MALEALLSKSGNYNHDVNYNSNTNTTTNLCSDANSNNDNTNNNQNNSNNTTNSRPSKKFSLTSIEEFMDTHHDDLNLNDGYSKQQQKYQNTNENRTENLRRVSTASNDPNIKVSTMSLTGQSAASLSPNTAAPHEKTENNQGQVTNNNTKQTTSSTNSNNNENNRSSNVNIISNNGRFSERNQSNSNTYLNEHDFSFKKKPLDFAIKNKRLNSNISSSGALPPQQNLEHLTCDPDHVKFFNKYKGIVDYKDKTVSSTENSSPRSLEIGVSSVFDSKLQAELNDYDLANKNRKSSLTGQQPPETTNRKTGLSRLTVSNNKRNLSDITQLQSTAKVNNNSNNSSRTTINNGANNYYPATFDLSQPTRRYSEPNQPAADNTIGYKKSILDSTNLQIHQLQLQQQQQQRLQQQQRVEYSRNSNIINAALNASGLNQNDNTNKEMTNPGLTRNSSSSNALSHLDPITRDNHSTSSTALNSNKQDQASDISRETNNSRLLEETSVPRQINDPHKLQGYIPAVLRPIEEIAKDYYTYGSPESDRKAKSPSSSLIERATMSDVITTTTTKENSTINNNKNGGSTSATSLCNNKQLKKKNSVFSNVSSNSNYDTSTQTSNSRSNSVSEDATVAISKQQLQQQLHSNKGSHDKLPTILSASNDGLEGVLSEENYFLLASAATVNRFSKIPSENNVSLHEVDKLSGSSNGTISKSSSIQSLGSSIATINKQSKVGFGISSGNGSSATPYQLANVKQSLNNIPYLEPTHTHWKSNDTRSNCAGCEAQFSLIKRKHHCRHCGDIFCFDCCNFKANLNLLAKFDISSLGKDSKVCKNCFDSWLQFLRKGTTIINAINNISENSNGINNDNNNNMNTNSTSSNNDSRIGLASLYNSFFASSSTLLPTKGNTPSQNSKSDLNPDAATTTKTRVASFVGANGDWTWSSF